MADGCILAGCLRSFGLPAGTPAVLAELCGVPSGSAPIPSRLSTAAAGVAANMKINPVVVVAAVIIVAVAVVAVAIAVRAAVDAASEFVMAAELRSQNLRLAVFGGETDAAGTSG